MKLWNFRTPLSLIASLIWNFAETYGIRLPYPHIIFGLMIQSRGKKQTKEGEQSDDK